MTWTLRPPSTSERLYAQKRHLVDANGQEVAPPFRSRAEHPMRPTPSDFISTTIEHVTPPPSLDEIRLKKAAQQADKSLRPKCDPAEMDELVRGIAFAGKSRDAMHERAQAITRLQELFAICPKLPAVQALTVALLGKGGCLDAAASCDGLLNALAVLGTEHAQLALAQFVQRAPSRYFNHVFTASIVLVPVPEPPLLDAMWARLHFHANSSHAASFMGAANSGALRLAAAAAANKASRADLDFHLLASTAPTRANISELIGKELIACATADARRKQAADEAASASMQHWEQLSVDHREAWVAHNGALSREGLVWEKAYGDYAHHERHAREVLRSHYLKRHHMHSASMEEAHSDRVIGALRAARNRADPLLTPSITPWLDHRHESVAAGAAHSLAALQGPQAEERMLARLEHQLHGGHVENPALTKKLLISLNAWQSVSNRTMGEAVRWLLKLPYYLPSDDDDTQTATCERECISGANPHAGVPRPEGAPDGRRLKAKAQHARLRTCEIHCSHLHDVANELKALVRKGRDAPNNLEVSPWVAAHAAESHPSLVVMHRQLHGHHLADEGRRRLAKLPFGFFLIM